MFLIEYGRIDNIEKLMLRNFKKTFYTVLGVVTLGCFAPSFAKAQHIVTESEAGKLTLASLTATPVVHHSSRHKYRVKRYGKAKLSTIAYRTRSGKRHTSLVHKVSYNHKSLGKVKVRNAVYHVSTHKKSKSRRHRS